MPRVSQASDNVEAAHVYLIREAVRVLGELCRLMGSPEGAFLDVEKGERQITAADREAIGQAHRPFACNLNCLIPPLLMIGDRGPDDITVDPRPRPVGEFEYPEVHYIRYSIARLGQVIGSDAWVGVNTRGIPPTWDSRSRGDRIELLECIAEFMSSLHPVLVAYGVKP